MKEKDDKNVSNVNVKRICSLPIGCKEEKCPKCGSNNLTGAIITDTADEQDPNILCLDCGFWRD